MNEYGNHLVCSARAALVYSLKKSLLLVLLLASNRCVFADSDRAYIHADMIGSNAFSVAVNDNDSYSLSEIRIIIINRSSSTRSGFLIICGPNDLWYRILCIEDTQLSWCMGNADGVVNLPPLNTLAAANIETNDLARVFGMTTPNETMITRKDDSGFTLSLVHLLDGIEVLSTWHDDHATPRMIVISRRSKEKSQPAIGLFDNDYNGIFDECGFTQGFEVLQVIDLRKLHKGGRIGAISGFPNGLICF